MSDQDYDGYTPSKRTFDDAIKSAPTRNEWLNEATSWQLLKHSFSQATGMDYVVGVGIFLFSIFTICYFT